MADTQVLPDAVWQQNGQAPKPRSLHGLRVSAVPNGAWLAQVLGGIAVLCGVFLIWGFAVALIVGGGAAMVLGTLHEAGLLKPGETDKTGG